MEDIIKSIAEAEDAASSIKAKAAERAEEIIARAAERAAEIAERAETDCKILREVEINRARENASVAYKKTVEESAAKAKKYADGVILKTEGIVNDIVGRITGGNR